MEWDNETLWKMKFSEEAREEIREDGNGCTSSGRAGGTALIYLGKRLDSQREWKAAVSDRNGLVKPRYQAEFQRTVDDGAEPEYWWGKLGQEMGTIEPLVKRERKWNGPCPWLKVGGNE